MEENIIAEQMDFKPVVILAQVLLDIIKHSCLSLIFLLRGERSVPLKSDMSVNHDVGLSCIQWRAYIAGEGRK